MTNSEFDEEYRIIAGHVLAMLGSVNGGVNRVKFITLATVPCILPFVHAELGDTREKFK